MHMKLAGHRGRASVAPVYVRGSSRGSPHRWVLQVATAMACAEVQSCGVLAMLCAVCWWLRGAQGCVSTLGWNSTLAAMPPLWLATHVFMGVHPLVLATHPLVQGRTMTTFSYQVTSCMRVCFYSAHVFSGQHDDVCLLVEVDKF